MGNTDSNKNVSNFGIHFFYIFLILLFILGGIAIYMNVSEKIKIIMTDINTSTVNIDGENTNIVTFMGNEKNNDILFIVFIICISILIALTLILFYLTEQKYNKFIYLQNKSEQLSEKFEDVKSVLEKEKGNITMHKKEVFKNDKIILKEKDNYTENKAILDLYKVYSNSLPELQ